MIEASPLFDGFPQFFDQQRELKVLDLACGSGRNGLWFLNRDHRVTFVDRDISAIPTCILQAPKASILKLDLESEPPQSLGQFDLVLVFNYLHRPLFPLIMNSVVNGGLLVYETFTHQQASLGRPKNPAFLLNDAELKQRFTQWQQLYYGEDSPKSCSDSHACKARIICRKPMDFPCIPIQKPTVMPFRPC